MEQDNNISSPEHAQNTDEELKDNISGRLKTTVVDGEQSLVNNAEIQFESHRSQDLQWEINQNNTANINYSGALNSSDYSSSMESESIAPRFGGSLVSKKSEKTNISQDFTKPIEQQNKPPTSQTQPQLIKSSSQLVISQNTLKSSVSSSSSTISKRHKVAKQKPKRQVGSCKAICYHLMEPLILAISIGSALQIPSVFTMIYVLIDLYTISPFILELQKTDAKKVVTWIKAFIALSVIVIKSIAYAWMNPESIKIYNTNMMGLFGFYYDKKFVTFFIDVLMVVLSVISLCLYKAYGKSYKDPDRILLHDMFGIKFTFFFYMTLIVLLVDSCLIQTFVQFFGLLIGGTISAKEFGNGIWNLRANFRADLLLLRICQICLVLQLSAQMALSLPGATVSFSQQTIAKMLGVQSLINGDVILEKTWLRIHIYTASLAILLIQTSIKSHQVLQRVKAKEQTQGTQELKKTKSTRVQTSQLPQTKQKTLRRSEFGRQVTKTQAETISKENKRKARRVQDKKADQATIWSTFKISFCLWAARGAAFVWVYMYHDWQALILLVFLFQSFMYKDRQLFIECLTYLYCPYVTLYMLWMYVTNIDGVNPYPWPYHSQTLEAYKYGFFPYQVPVLEQGLLVIYVFTFIVLLRVLVADKGQTKFDKDVIKQFTKDSTQTFYQIMLLFVIYIELPLMLILVFMGLYENNFYHLSLLFFFIFYMISPDCFNKNIKYLLIYANVYIVEKYLYTLVADYQKDPGVWWQATGFQATYDPMTEREYFRYTIKWDEWLLVLLSFTIYRRIQLLGYGDDARTTKKVTKQQLRKKMPRCAKFMDIVHIVYFHFSVAIAFTLILVSICIMQHSLINDVSQFIILSLLVLYLTKGVTVLLRYWGFIVVYQAIVLMCLIVYFFIMDSALTDALKVKEWSEYVEKNQIDFQFIGLYSPKDTKQWKMFFPYVLMFVLTVILFSVFKEKVRVENQNFEPPGKDAVLKAYANKYREFERRKTEINLSKSGRAQTNVEKKLLDVSDQNIKARSEIASKASNESFLSFDKHQDESILDTHKKQLSLIPYNLSYFIFKLKNHWWILDSLAACTFLALNMTVLCYAAYYQIALVWAIFLLFFAIQVISMHNSYRRMKLKQEKGFELRSDNIPEKQFETKHVTQHVILEHPQELEEDIDFYAQQRGATKVLQQEKLQLQLSEILKESVDSKKIKITDEQVLEEVDKFKELSNQVRLSHRKQMWGYQMFLLILALTVLYLSEYAAIDQFKDKNRKAQSETVFFLFFCGVFHENSGGESYWKDAAPFYVMLFLLVIDRVSQMWHENHLGCDEKSIEIFTAIQEAQQAIDQFKKDKIFENSQREKFKTSIDYSQNSDKQKGSSLLNTVLGAIPEDPLEDSIARPQSEPIAQEYIPSRRTRRVIESNSSINESFHRANSDDSEENDELLVQIDDDAQQNRSLYDQLRDLSEQDFNKRSDEVKSEISRLLHIKYIVKQKAAIKVLLESMLLLLAWCYVIYCEDLVANFTFICLCYYSLTMNKRAIFFAWFSIIISFVLTYWMTLSNLSSYNSPKQFPSQLLPEDPDAAQVYPHGDYYFLHVPVTFSIARLWNGKETVPLATSDYFGFYWTAQQQFQVRCWLIILIWTQILLSNRFFAFWMYSGEKMIVIQSQKLQDLIHEEAIIHALKIQRKSKDGSLIEIESDATTYTRLKQESSFIKNVINRRKFIFMHWHNFVIVFILSISIFNVSVLSFGYFIFCMVMIANTKKAYSFREGLRKNLKYYLMPYLLIDIMSVLVFQIPAKRIKYALNTGWVKSIGIENSWVTEPATISYGEEMPENGVVATAQKNVTSLILKGLVFSVIYIQLRIIESNEFSRFMIRALKEKTAIQNTVSRSFAYRFNNLKSEKYIYQSAKYTELDDLKKYVFEMSSFLVAKIGGGAKKYGDETVWSKPSRTYNTQSNLGGDSSSQLNNSLMYSQHMTSQLSQSRHQTAEQKNKINKLKKEQLDQEQKLWSLYKKKHRKLNCCVRFYLYLRHKFVAEVMFRKSLKHMYELMETVKQGETFIMTTDEKRILDDCVEQLTWLESEKQKLSQELTQDQTKAIMKSKESEADVKFSSVKPSCQKMTNRYFTLINKILVSKSDIICYIFMLICTVTNGGYLYLFYPISIFGYAFVIENRPGAKYWYSVLIFTQVMILLNFFVQLDVWNQIFNANQLQDAYQWLVAWNLGFFKVRETDRTFSGLLKAFAAEILIIIAVLLHIQHETEAGLFNVSCYQIEDFEKGWKRYLNYKIYPENKRDDHDEVLGNIFNKLPENPDRISKTTFDEEGNEIEEVNSQGSEEYKSNDSDELSDEVEEENNLDQISDIEMLERDPSFDASSIDLDALLGEKKPSCCQRFLASCSKYFYENKFVLELFPPVKQQKPGYDYYTFIMTTQLVLIVYLFLFYSQMDGSQQAFTQQLQSSQFSGAMVASVFVLIFIMLIDRIIYTISSFKASEDEQGKGDLSSSVLQEESNQSKIQVSRISSSSQVFREIYSSEGLMEQLREGSKDYSLQSKETILVDFDEQQGIIEVKDPNRWKLDKLEEQRHQTLRINVHSLDLQSRLVKFSQTVRLPWFIFVLMFVHIWIFIVIPRWSFDCKYRKSADIGSLQSQACSFQNYTATVFFYLIFCIYFTLCAYQIKDGVPESRRGSFAIQSYNKINYYAYLVYLGIPFIFELRSIIDWTFTGTSLDVFQWIKLASIQANMYIAKCFNRPYMEKETGAKIGKCEKFWAGCCLWVIVILLIIGPLILFSSLSPASSQISTNGGSLQMTFRFTPLYQTSANNTRVTNDFMLYDSTKAIFNQAMDQTTYDELGLKQMTGAIQLYEPNQISSVQMNIAEDHYWDASESLFQGFINEIDRAIAGENNVKIEFDYAFTKISNNDTSTIAQARGNQELKMSSGDKGYMMNLEQMKEAVNCTGRDYNNESDLTKTTRIRNKNQINPALLVSVSENLVVASTFDQNLWPWEFLLKYTCQQNEVTPSNGDPFNVTTGYWSLAQDLGCTVRETECTNNGKRCTTKELQSMKRTCENEKNIFPNNGFFFFLFNGTELPAILTSFGSSITVFYVVVVYAFAGIFHDLMVPKTYEIYQVDAPHPDKILNICQAVYIHRYRREYKQEESIYMLLVDIMRSPERLKELAETSIKTLPSTEEQKEQV